MTDGSPPSSTDGRGERADSGIAGLNDILGGGYPTRRSYLVHGVPGSGKTTLAMQFLLAGAALGERTLYITLSESREELEGVAASHGWTLDRISLVELSVIEDLIEPADQTTMFHPFEVDLARTMARIMAEVERVDPVRVVFDSLAELRLLCQDPLLFRRQLLAMKQRLLKRGATVLLLDDRSIAHDDQQVQSIVHGVITLERSASGYGTVRRRLIVDKLRGSDFRTGVHDYAIRRGGLVIFPRLVAAEHLGPAPEKVMPSGVSELDEMLSGGIERGSSLLLVGPAGTGKSSLAASFLAAAGARGERSVLMAFEETHGIFLKRSQGLGFDLGGDIAAGRLRVQQVDPANISPGELANDVRYHVEEGGARLLVIDSLTGYLGAMPDEQHLHLHLHELLTYLGQRGVVTIMTLAQHGLMGPMRSGDISYIADSVIMIRYFEAFGAVKKALSVVKKRTGSHEETIREFSMSGGRIRVGEPLSKFQGVLSGTPIYHGRAEDMLRERA